MSRAGGMSRSLRNLTLRFSWIVSSGLSVVENIFIVIYGNNFSIKKSKVQRRGFDGETCRQTFVILELLFNTKRLFSIEAPEQDIFS